MLFFISIEGFSCTTCDRALQEKLYDSTFLPNLFIMLSAFLVLALLVGLLSYLSTKSYRTRLAANPDSMLLNPVPLATAATVLGIGIGGFIDGIVLHQILQWHEMISNKLPPVTLEAKSINMFWDGIFHAFTLLVVVVGIVLQWKLLFRKNINRSGKLLTGGLLIGWGLFNLVEGIIDHHLLKLHHVREITEDVELWNYGFLGFSVLLLLLGFAMVKKAKSISNDSVNSLNS